MHPVAIYLPDLKRVPRKNVGHHHVACVIRRNRLLAKACNKPVNPRRYGPMNTQHAEMAVLEELGDYTKLAGAKLYVFRITKEGRLALSKPCANCARVLEKCMTKHGLRQVCYSTD